MNQGLILNLKFGILDFYDSTRLQQLRGLTVMNFGNCKYSAQVWLNNTRISNNYSLLLKVKYDSLDIWEERDARGRELSQKIQTSRT